MLNNTKNSYGWLSIALHWLSAIVVFGMFALGVWMVELGYYSPWYKEAPYYHKSVGLLLCGLIILRLIWKSSQIRPAGIGKHWEQALAKLVHTILYVGLFSLFLSGYLISTADGRGIDIFNWVTIPSLGEWIDDQEVVAGDIHQWLAYGLIGLVVIHAFAALKHHFIEKDSTIKRMIKPFTQNKDLQ